MRGLSQLNRTLEAPRHPILGELPEEERRPTPCMKSRISLGGIKKTGLNKGSPVLLLIRKEKLYG